jgi:replicative DNA helicase
MSTREQPKIVHEWPDLIEAIEAYRARRSNPRVTTGLASLDRILGGLDPGLHVLQAAPGAGKTALALQVACYMANQGRQVRYLSAEMAPAVVAHRIAQSLDVPLDDLSRLRLPSLLSGPWNMRELALMARDETVDLLIVDSLHAAATTVASGGDSGPMSEYDLLSAWSTSLSMVGVETETAILAIAHRNRTSNTKGSDAGLHAAKGTGNIEYLAETVVDLSTPRDELVANKRERLITATVEKNRQGATGRVELRFDTWRQTFRE